MPPELSRRTYDSGRSKGRTEVETNIKTIRIPTHISEIFMIKVRELIDSLSNSPQIDGAIIMDYHLTCTLEPKPVFEEQIVAEEEKSKI